MEATGTLAAVYESSYQRLVAQLVAICGSQYEAEDAVQEAFVKAVGQGLRWDAVDNPEAWLRTVAVNVVRRRWRRRKLLDLILLRERAVQRHVEAGPSPERTDLTEALDAIPRPYREVIVLHYYADLSVDEIADALGVPSGTVKSRLSRGRTALAQHLEGYRPEVTRA